MRSGTVWAPRTIVVAVAGPMLAGILLGVRQGAGLAVTLAIGLPVVILAVTALTAPSLYVGGLLLGLRFSVAELGACFGRALHAVGVAMLGLTPLGLLLAATSTAPDRGCDCDDAVGPMLAGVGLVGLALVVGLHRLRSELGPAQRPVAFQFFLVGYAAVAMVIGARLVGEVIDLGGKVWS